jgi:hypothetical protein
MVGPVLFSDAWIDSAKPGNGARAFGARESGWARQPERD